MRPAGLWPVVLTAMVERGLGAGGGNGEEGKAVMIKMIELLARQYEGG